MENTNTNAPIQHVDFISNFIIISLKPVRKATNGHVLAFQEDDSDTRNKRRIAQTMQSEQEELEEEAKIRERVYRKLLDPRTLNQSDTYGQQKPKKLPMSDISARPASSRTALEEQLYREEKKRIAEYEKKYGSDNDLNKSPIEKLVIGNWWFSTEEWPPKDYNYDEELKKRGLREVSLSFWQNEQEFDSEHRKPFESLYIQVYFRLQVYYFTIFSPNKFYKHLLYDLRPKKHPLYDELKKKSIPELLQLYKTSVLNQYAQYKVEQTTQPIQTMEEESKIIEEKKSGSPLSKRSRKIYPSRLILRTWWFNTQDWPPRDYDYQPYIKFHRLSLVSIEEMKSEWGNPRQAFEIPLHPGVFQTFHGSLYDMRPKRKYPSFEVLESKTIGDLVDKLYDRMNADAAAGIHVSLEGISI